MQVVLIASAEQKQEWLSQQAGSDPGLIWIEDVEALQQHAGAEVIIDLLFENTPGRKQKLLQQSALIMINSVSDTLEETNRDWVRLAGWPGFLGALEAACSGEQNRKRAEEALRQLGKTITWVADQPGFITPRVISMIINEAWLALAEGVSTREEIDTAMKLGTAYPYGPFEWSRKIGLQNIVTLLEKLSVAQPRYTPAALLLQETNKGI